MFLGTFAYKRAGTSLGIEDLAGYSSSRRSYLLLVAMASQSVKGLWASKFVSTCPALK